MLKIFRIFSVIQQGPFLDLPKIKFNQENFDVFLKKTYTIEKPPKITFGSSPLRWIFGLFQYKKNNIILFWPGIITKALSENSNIPLYFASVLAHETSHLIESQKFWSKLWLNVQYLFYYFFIFISGFWIFSKTFLFFPLNLLLWLLPFLLYFFLPSEIKARKFAKQQVGANQENWLVFFETN